MRWSLAATAVFVAVEIVAGLRAHSLALLSDAGHNFTDALALLLAWFGHFLESKPADETNTYGYQRAGVLAAFVNALTLVALSVWIVYESVLRLSHPQTVAPGIMIAIAAVALVLNTAIMVALRPASHHDLNVRGAFVHMLGDAVGSLAIAGAAIGIHYTGWQQLDPLLSMAIALLIVWTAWGIVRESLEILLEGLPRGLNLATVEAAIKGVAGVLGVHHLHIWSLGSRTRALSCHVLIDDIPLSASDAVLCGINELLADRFQIFHTTVQFEHSSCAISESGCAIPTSGDCEIEEHQHHSHPHRH